MVAAFPLRKKNPAIVSAKRQRVERLGLAGVAALGRISDNGTRYHDNAAKRFASRGDAFCLARRTPGLHQVRAVDLLSTSETQLFSALCPTSNIFLFLFLLSWFSSDSSSPFLCPIYQKP